MDVYAPRARATRSTNRRLKLPQKTPTTRNAIFFFSAIPATPSIDYFAAASGDSPTDAISGKGPANRMPRRFTTSLLNRLRLIFLTRQAVLLAYKNESQRRLPAHRPHRRQQTHRHLIHLFIVVFASNWQAQLPARPQLCFFFIRVAGVLLCFPSPDNLTLRRHRRQPATSSSVRNGRPRHCNRLDTSAKTAEPTKASGTGDKRTVGRED